MTISNILEHWATIYKPLSHKKEGKLEEQSFFRIRYIDLENIFSRNANIIHSPCMLYSVLTTGDFVDKRMMRVSHQVWFLMKVKDTPQTLGRYDGNKIEMAAEDLMECCKDMVSWMQEVKDHGECPITHRFFADEPLVMKEMESIDISSFSCGLIGELYSGQWLVAGVNWDSLQPLYRFGCNSNGKYIVPATDDNQQGGADSTQQRKADSTQQKQANSARQYKPIIAGNPQQG